jgi:Ser/Thr protein kinase RdoA (MazF antagonist)
MDGPALSVILGSDVAKVDSTQLCSLWAGYGEIQALTVKFATTNHLSASYILKIVKAPNHDGEAHNRKIMSYIVEAAFYQHFACRAIDRGIAVARPFTVQTEPSGKIVVLMDDLREKFPSLTDGMLNTTRTAAAIEWLAKFHAEHWEVVDTTSAPYNALWPEGCYWRLDTRLSEYEDIPSAWQQLKNCAHVVADLLKSGTSGDPLKHTTLVHGDFKSPNILFTQEPRRQGVRKKSNDKNEIKGEAEACECAVVDFQYVGKGYGARDLVMLITSSVQFPAPYSHKEAVALEKHLLTTYHSRLLHHLGCDGASPAPYTFQQLSQHYELCLIDYVRFMAGWGMWGNTRYAETRTRELLAVIDGGVALSPAEYEQRFRAHYCT